MILRAVDATNHTIAIEVPFATDISSLISTFTLSTGANAEISGASQESGITVNDFTSSVVYTVVAEDGITSQDWAVTVTKVPLVWTMICVT